MGCMILIPCMGTHIYQKYRPSVDWEQSSEGLVVYMEQKGIDQVLDFETYAIGVLGAVLDSDVHDETLKTMAVILRTYLYCVAENRTYVDGTRLNQPWMSARERWIKGVEDERLRRAIRETKDCIILYKGEPILPLYYAISNGKTRYYSEVWNGNIEYLVSVESLWDKSAPEYIQKFSFSEGQWQRAWSHSVDIKDDTVDSGGQWSADHMQIVEKDSAGYVKQIQIGAEVYSGEEVRQRLGLSSACFDYVVKKSHIEFTCYGEGHGVGLSLFGANAMANEGKTWREIISWYFPETDV